MHCTYSYTHFNGKPGALALRSNETTVSFAGTFRTGVGRGRGLAGEPRPAVAPPSDCSSPFYEWKAAILNESRTRSGRPLFSQASDGVRRGGGRGPEAGASAGGAKFCGAGGGGCARLSSFRRALSACAPRPSSRPHPGIRFPVGESRTIPPTFVL
ncbi:hypothetical protein RR48_06151 [Papilio machaon]|uniref:Uncharacterized protein n=1 Tax=Papilio machaon TaxID=76193 RepID=A0A194RSG2_PAPMA|nr:hypothetical protein RR48_06151 [Papilio machaon]